MLKKVLLCKKNRGGMEQGGSHRPRGGRGGAHEDLAAADLVLLFLALRNVLRQLRQQLAQKIFAILLVRNPFFS